MDDGHLALRQSYEDVVRATMLTQDGTRVPKQRVSWYEFVLQLGLVSLVQVLWQSVPRFLPGKEL